MAAPYLEPPLARRRHTLEGRCAVVRPHCAYDFITSYSSLFPRAISIEPAKGLQGPVADLFS